jgi:hypothetical protein
MRWTLGAYSFGNKDAIDCGLGTHARHTEGAIIVAPERFVDDGLKVRQGLKPIQSDLAVIRKSPSDLISNSFVLLFIYTQEI